MQYSTSDKPEDIMQRAVNRVCVAAEHIGADDMRLPDAETIGALIRGAYSTRRQNGRAIFRLKSSPGKGASDAVRFLHSLVKWNSGNGDLHGLMGASLFCPLDSDTKDRVESLAMLLSVLSGKTNAVNAWSQALGRSS